MQLDDAVISIVTGLGGAALGVGIAWGALQSKVSTLKDETKKATDEIDAIKKDRERAAIDRHAQQIKEAEERGALYERLKQLETQRPQIAGEIAAVEGRLMRTLADQREQITSHFDRVVEIINAHALANAEREDTATRRIREMQDNDPSLTRQATGRGGKRG